VGSEMCIRDSRMTLRTQVDLTHGIGGAVACVRFVPNPRERKALVAWLQETALPRVIARPGLLGAFAAENDVETANAPLQEKSMDHPRVEEAEWIVVLEGADAASVGTAARMLFKPAALKHFGVTAVPTIGTYRLLFGNQR
jgi:hypothetical protein